MAQSLITSETLQCYRGTGIGRGLLLSHTQAKASYPMKRLEKPKQEQATSFQTTGHFFSVHLHPEAEGALLTRESHKTSTTTECPSSTLVLEVSMIRKKQLVLSLQEICFFSNKQMVH